MSNLFGSQSSSSKTPITIVAGRFFFANRLLFGLIIALVAGSLVHPRLSWNLGTAVKPLSLVLVLLGIGLRALAGGCAGLHTRTADIEGPRLATGGPYAFVRNPIYLGSMVLGLGIVGLVGSWVMLIPYGSGIWSVLLLRYSGRRTVLAPNLWRSISAILRQRTKIFPSSSSLVESRTSLF